MGAGPQLDFTSLPVPVSLQDQDGPAVSEVEEVDTVPDDLDDHVDVTGQHVPLDARPSCMFWFEGSRIVSRRHRLGFSYTSTEFWTEQELREFISRAETCLKEGA